MPRPTTEPYIPVAQTYNDDPETWEMTDEFGDRSVRTHLEILSIIERTNNHWRLVEGWQSAIGRKCRQSPKTIQGIVEWMIQKGWLTISQWLASHPPAIRQLLASDPPMVGQLLASGWPVILRAGKYPKFHKVDVPSWLEDGFEYVFPLPSLLPSEEKIRDSGIFNTMVDTKPDQEKNFFNNGKEDSPDKQIKIGLNGSQSHLPKDQAEELTPEQKAELKRLMKEAGVKDETD